MPTTQDDLVTYRRRALATPSELGSEAVENITGALNTLLADVLVALRPMNLAREFARPAILDTSAGRPVATRVETGVLLLFGGRSKAVPEEGPSLWLFRCPVPTESLPIRRLVLKVQ